MVNDYNEIWVLWYSGNYRIKIHSKCVCDMIQTYNQMHHTDKYSQNCSIIWVVLLNSWMFLYELSGCGFKSRYNE